MTVSQQPIATVVVVNYNGEHLLRECMEGLRSQDLGERSFSTWVVDNGSTDGSVDLLRRLYPEVRVIESKLNLGFAGGNNLALREVETPFAVLLNNDAVPEPSWLRELLAPFGAAQNSRLGAVTPKVLFQPRFLRLELFSAQFVSPGDTKNLGVQLHAVSVDGTNVTEKVRSGDLYPRSSVDDPYRWTRPVSAFLVPVAQHTSGPIEVRLVMAADADRQVVLRWLDGEERMTVRTEPRGFDVKVMADHAVNVINGAGSFCSVRGWSGEQGFGAIDVGQFDSGCEVFAFGGNGVALRREMLDSVGLFDEDFFTYYEDTDLSWRARAAGWTIRYEPKAILRHRHASTSGEWSDMFAFHVERNRLLMLLKNARARLAITALSGFIKNSIRVVIGSSMAHVGLKQKSVRRPVAINLRVAVSLARLMAPMLRRRRTINRSRIVSHSELERWFVA
jgi:hypothetical protein